MSEIIRATFVLEHKPPFYRVSTQEIPWFFLTGVTKPGICDAIPRVAQALLYRNRNKPVIPLEEINPVSFFEKKRQRLSFEVVPSVSIDEASLPGEMFLMANGWYLFIPGFPGERVDEDYVRRLWTTLKWGWKKVPPGAPHLVEKYRKLMESVS